MRFLLAAALWASAVMARRHMHEIQVEVERQIFEREAREAQQKGGAFGGAAGPPPPPTVHWSNISLPIDYRPNSKVGNFSNRFWVVDDYYKPGGPVITLDTGESNGGQGYLNRLTETAAFVNQLLREFNAIGLVWEHRYYGESLPFPIDNKTPAEHFQYLTTENALKDFIVFAEQFQWKNFTVSPKKTPWVVVGGSYPGMRAAFLRHLYPETIYAAYASSAPVQAQTDMSIYWEQAYRGFLAYNLKNCTEYIQLAAEHIDSQLANPRTSGRLKKQFLGRTAEKNSNEGFADAMLFPMYNWQAGGVDADIRSFCNHLHNGSETVQGASRKVRAEHFSNRWASWPKFAELTRTYISTGYCEGPVPQNKTEPNCLLDLPFEGTFSISWTWQYCTEWGFYQPNNMYKGQHPLSSRFNDLEHQQEICYRQFPDGLKSGYLPKVPDNRKVNRLTDGWWMNPSNVFWTGGEFDPWRTLSKLSKEDFAPHFKVDEDIPSCNRAPPRDTVFGHLLARSEHCYDLRSAEIIPAAKKPQEIFKQALKEWFKCFRKS